MIVVSPKAGAVALVVGLVGIVAFAPGVARAGVPECGNIRIEAGAQCRLELGGGCEAQCSLGVYEKACATYGYQTCNETCTLPPVPECTDECTELCADQCEVGIEVVCHQNCFPECVDECAASCEAAEDTIQCRASCEATCDGECDHQCAMLPVDASCYSHCLECCGGSCNASANMDCQLECQDHALWEQCEYELQVKCDASCDVEGALFCDGQLVAAGAELEACASALVQQGIEVLELEEEVEELEDAVEELEDGWSQPLGSAPTCACRGGAEGRSSGWGALLALLGLASLRRRTRRGTLSRR
jgi:MYXO-CTERM domain-containing protein